MKLTRQELEFFGQVKNRGLKIKLAISIGIPMSALIMSFIPVKYLPGRDLDLDPNTTIAESRGLVSEGELT